MTDIDVLLEENRKFPPTDEFRRRRRSSRRRRFTTRQRETRSLLGKKGEELQWMRKWDKVLDWKPPHAQWFVGGKLNASVNCLDRHLTARARMHAR
jgi:acetyl-CoA synthetase